MSTRTIRDVDDETWKKLKVLSSEESVKMSKLIKNMTDDYIKNRKTAWDRILNAGKILSDSEADDMIKIVEKLRKERGFR